MDIRIYRGKIRRDEDGVERHLTKVVVEEQTLIEDVDGSHYTVQFVAYSTDEHTTINFRGMAGGSEFVTASTAYPTAHLIDVAHRGSDKLTQLLYAVAARMFWT